MARRGKAKRAKRVATPAVAALAGLPPGADLRPRAAWIWTEERARYERATREDHAPRARGPCERSEHQN